jgi:hypothetical protein
VKVYDVRQTGWTNLTEKLRIYVKLLHCHVAAVKIWVHFYL